MPGETSSAVIVGAGIAGLSTALALSRRGWRVLVVERAAALRGGAYVVGFSGLGYDAAERLGLIPALRRLAAPWSELQHVDGRGRSLATMSVEAQQALVGDRVISILRGDLERVLFAALDDRVEVRFGSAPTAVENSADGVHVTLSDGTRVSADLLVGADGLHSAVRRMVFGPEEEARHDFGALVASFELAEPPAELAGRTTMLALVGRGAGVYPQRDRRLAVFFLLSSDRVTEDLAAGPVANLRRRFGDLGWAWPTIVERAASAESIYFDSISQIRLPSWSRDRVVLVGDAAWSVSLLAGYGSSLAVGGGELLASSLSGHREPAAALAEWERRMRPLVLSKQRDGRRSRDLFLPRNGLSLAVRSTLLKLGSTRPGVALSRRLLGLQRDRIE